MVKSKRPKMETLQELYGYLETNKRELPFDQQVWDKAVEVTSERKERKVKLVDDGTGRLVPKKSHLNTNPVSEYFRLVSLPQNKKRILAEKALREKNDNMQFDDIETTFEDEYDEDDSEENKEAISILDVFFKTYSDGDKMFLKERLSDYYDNYEINEGADKMLVVNVVSDELEVMKLTALRNKRNSDVEDKLKKIKETLIKELDSLKALKKQRGRADEGKNKFTQWVDELTKEGDFKFEFETHDDIDTMLSIFQTGIINTFKDGGL